MGENIQGNFENSTSLQGVEWGIPFGNKLKQTLRAVVDIASNLNKHAAQHSIHETARTSEKRYPTGFNCCGWF